jgi:pimeloyl-ACP methyl ester carboxylesterase
MQELILHTVKKGSVVIYPRWQTGLLVPCAGSINIEPCMTSVLNGIRGALQFLQADPSRVQPELEKTTYFGFSFGGILTSNLANRYASLGLPEPRAIFLDDPHDGGFAGVGEPGLDGTLAGIPATTKFVCHSGADGVIKEANKGNSSCNAIFPRLGHIPAENKDLVLLSTDTYGDPDLSSAHGVSSGVADAYDWYFTFKQWDALRQYALFGANQNAALGNNPERRTMGLWTNGVPIKQLKIQQVAPIAP